MTLGGAGTLLVPAQVLCAHLITMRKIVVTGPESSGKTTLSAALAKHYATVWVPEQSRPFLDTLGRGYVEDDLRAIGEQQLRAEDEIEEALELLRTPLMFCDTDLITIRIWGEEKYGKADPWVKEVTEQRSYELWLLCAPDMPWEPDPLRENPHDRDRLFAVYESTLQALGKSYLVMRGKLEERMAAAVEAIGG